MRRNYVEYPGVAENANESGGKGSADKVNLDELLEQDLLLGLAGDAEGVTEEAPTSARKFILAMGGAVPIAKRE